MTTVAFIGLGAMGSRMAMNLHAAGHKLRVYNRDRAKTKPFADKGIEVCDSPAAAAKGAEFVCSIVSDDVATREVMLGASGVVGAAAPGTIILDSSTNTPAMAKEVAGAAAAKGIAYLDAPVSGSIAQAQAKELVILVGGDKTAFDKAQPVLLAMGRMGRRIGGLGAAGGAAVCRLMKTKLPKMFKRDFSPQFQLELMEKDMRYFLQLAQDLDRPAPIASLVRSQYQAAKRAQLGKLDTCAVFL